MPYSIINQVRELTSMNFGIATDSTTILGEGVCPDLPDEVMDMVYEIGQKAKQFFGAVIEPTPRQKHCFTQAGFDIELNEFELGRPKNAFIVTTKGKIRYR